MKKLAEFSYIATSLCVLYFICDVVGLFIPVPVILDNIKDIALDVSFIVFFYLLAMQYNDFKRSTNNIIIANLLSITNVVLVTCMRNRPNDTMITMTLIIGVIYLLYLIFLCIGFFNLKQQLPKPSLPHNMALIYPCTYFIQLGINIIIPTSIISHTHLQWLYNAISLLQIISITLLIYSLPKTYAKIRPINNP